eukprot:TRINITY_DN12516_c1_g1_i2.p1 TRINITY_DN12516_c1_g1~~TRINITY_DN12516_c1_g1_i2.p1  ORF type:complete len:101 (-),score=4.26 TRINITY_DN12516_c1_g1_i2:65-367(-)
MSQITVQTVPVEFVPAWNIARGGPMYFNCTAPSGCTGSIKKPPASTGSPAAQICWPAENLPIAFPDVGDWNITPSSVAVYVSDGTSTRSTSIFSTFLWCS